MARLTGLRIGIEGKAFQRNQPSQISEAMRPVTPSRR
jgi:hypothetical protein